MELLKAFSLYLNKGGWNVYLVLMGEGEYMEELKQLAKDLGVYSRTIFLPFNLNPYKYMAHADLFVLSSIFEGFPIVLAEGVIVENTFCRYKKSYTRRNV